MVYYMRYSKLIVRRAGVLLEAQRTSGVALAGFTTGLDRRGAAGSAEDLSAIHADPL